mgnify:CR=1 FL=1
MKKLALISFPAFLLTCLFSTAHAAEDQIVIEDLSPAQLRAEIAKIQTEYYRVFNLINTDDKLDIVCRKYTPTGSNIRKEACEPQFVIDRRGRNTADAQAHTDELRTTAELQNELAAEFQALTDAINAVAKENKYFSELSSILGVLQERLKEITS